MGSNDILRAENVAAAKKMVEHDIITQIEKKYSGVSLERNYDVDVLSQLRANLEQVEELNARLRFNLIEVNQLVAKRR